jgi:Transposase DDE domain group 1
VFAIALSYGDLNGHDELRYNPVMAALASKLEERREACEPAAGKSTLTRLELSQWGRRAFTRSVTTRLPSSGRWSKFSLRHTSTPSEIIFDLDATDDPVHGEQGADSSTATTIATDICRSIVFCGRHLLMAKLRPASLDVKNLCCGCR